MGEFEYFAVCAPVCGDRFLFEVRSDSVPQPLEISFPGGKIEPGEEPLEAAARELFEETGLTVGRLLFRLEPLVTPFNFVVLPFVVEVDPSTLRPNKSEVSEVFFAPVSHFLTPERIGYVSVELRPFEDFPFELLPSGRSYHWKTGHYSVLFFRWEHRVVWGITARIANRAAQLLLESAKVNL